MAVFLRSLGLRSNQFVNKLSQANASRLYATVPPYVTNVPPTKVTTLPSGLRVATEAGFGETATVGIFINAGSVYENEKTNGAAHFLEHMAFKGTDRRTRQGIEMEVENMGGHLNAYTSREQTVYFAKVFKRNVGDAVDILSDILQNSKLSEEHIESERGVILREMQEVENNIDEVVFDHLHNIAFQGTPLGFTILGPRENIRTLSRDDLKNYIQNHYTADRMVLVGSGAVDHNELVQLAEKSFTNLPTKSQIDFNNLPKHKYTGSMVTVSDTTKDKVHLAVAVEGPSWSSPDFLPMMVMQAMIGNWNKSMGSGKNAVSRLAEKYATEGCADSLMSFNTCYHNTGLFGSYVICDPQDAEDSTSYIPGEWVRIALSANKNEVERAKDKLKATMLMQLDGTTPVAEDIGRQLLTLGRRVSPAELFLRIDAINENTIRDVATRYCYDQCPAVVAIGDLIDFPDYNFIRGWTYWNRL